MFSIQEILDIVIMSLALGFIFKDVFMPGRRTVLDRDNYDPLERYRVKKHSQHTAAKRTGKSRSISDYISGINKSGFIFAMVIAAPAVILHEFGHKLIAMSMGFTAEFNAAYFWLGLGVLLKLLNFGFIFFVPAYVSIGGGAITPIQYSAIAFAGPAVNLVLFLVPFLLLKNAQFRKKFKKYISILSLTSKINLFLFIFNMLPLPMFDGFKVFSGLIQAFI